MVACLIATSLLIYFAVISKNIFATKVLSIVNDIIIAVVVGVLTGIVITVFSFIFLNIIKKAWIRDFYSFYAYIHSLKHRSKLITVKDRRFLDRYYDKVKSWTKEEYIQKLAEIFKYTENSIEYKNLINEVNEDFAKHGYLDPNIEKTKKDAYVKAFIFDLISPLLVVSALIVCAVLYNDGNPDSLYALTRLLAVAIVAIITVNVAIFTYEIVQIKKVHNIKTYNDFVMLSFNNYAYGTLSSMIVKKR